MYIINFFVHSIRKAGNATFSICRERRVATENGESAALVTADEKNEYESMDERHSRRKGFTEEWVDYYHSETAFKWCLFNLVVYVGLAVLAFSFVFERFPIGDSIYLAFVIVTTVGKYIILNMQGYMHSMMPRRLLTKVTLTGYGDLSPSTDSGRLFAVFYVLYGIVILGVFLGIGGALIIEQHEKALERRIANARAKIMDQFNETVPEEDSSKGKTIWQHIWGIVELEAPIVAILLVLSIPICYAEGWNLIQR
jgi:hypothetical protein